MPPISSIGSNMSDSSVHIDNGNTVKERDGLTSLELIQSTLWAALGVQRSENRVRDFTHGHWLQFVFMGIGFTAFFVGTLIGIVHLVLAN